MKKLISWIKGLWYYNVTKKIAIKKTKKEIVDLYCSFFNLSEILAENIEKYNVNLPIKIRKEILMDICYKYINEIKNFDHNQFFKFDTNFQIEDLAREIKITKDGLEIDYGTEFFLEAREILDMNIFTSQERNLFRFQAMSYDLINIFGRRNLEDFVKMYIKEDYPIRNILNRGIKDIEDKIIFSK
jgi:hypothetical protein